MTAEECQSKAQYALDMARWATDPETRGHWLSVAYEWTVIAKIGEDGWRLSGLAKALTLEANLRCSTTTEGPAHNK